MPRLDGRVEEEIYKGNPDGALRTVKEATGLGARVELGILINLFTSFCEWSRDGCAPVQIAEVETYLNKRRYYQ